MSDSKQNADAIPVVDITALRNGSDPANVAAALHHANTGLGFIYITGHGIPEQLISSVQDAGMAFFRSSTAQKGTVPVTPSHRGWIKQGNAKMHDDAKADLKESFLWGYQSESGIYPDDHELRGPNQWPEAFPEMESLCMEYFQAAHEVAEHLMRGFALGLGLDARFFLRSSDKPISRNSFVYYPPQTANSSEGQFGVSRHTDFGVLTVLCQDKVGGLEVENLRGEWIKAPPIEGTLIVNVGDLLARWTDGAYHSTPHRVINKSGKERLSLVLAYDPNPETMIDPKEVFGSDYMAKEPAISCGDYLTWRFQKAFKHKQT
jgi:isopenicillin N synthase-like dioxygenase